MTTLWHATTADKAARIMAEGLRDHATVNKRLFSGERRYPAGVWFGSVPAIDDELFDGIGLFDFDAERQAFVAVTVPQPIPTAIHVIRGDTTWPGVQYWGPAAVWNAFPRRQLSLDDAIKARITTAPAKFIRGLRSWIKQERDYNTEFLTRVRSIVAEASHA